MLSVVSAGAAAGVGGMDRLRGGRAARELAATRDRQVRLHAVHTDIAINLPPNIAMPDGEEHPFTSSRLHIRDPEQVRCGNGAVGGIGAAFQALTGRVFSGVRDPPKMHPTAAEPHRAGVGVPAPVPVELGRPARLVEQQQQ